MFFLNLIGCKLPILVDKTENCVGKLIKAILEINATFKKLVSTGFVELCKYASSQLIYSYRKLISCSEDGSVRMWELHEKQHLTAEPVPSGLYTKK